MPELDPGGQWHKWQNYMLVSAQFILTPPNELSFLNIQDPPIILLHHPGREQLVDH